MWWRRYPRSLSRGAGLSKENEEAQAHKSPFVATFLRVHVLLIIAALPTAGAGCEERT